MKEAYAGKDARDVIKRDPKFTRLPSDTKKDIDKALEKGNIVDLGEDSLDEMEFFPVAVDVPEELPTPGKIYSALTREAESLVDSSYIDSNDASLSVVVTFLRKSDAENYKEFASSLGVPEEYINEPGAKEEPEMEDELYETSVLDLNGNELFIDDVVSIKGRKYKIGEGTNGKACLFSLSGRKLLEISDPRAHAILAASVKEDIDIGHQDDEPDMLKQYVYDIATYAAKLYKQLDTYDKMPEEVDFPNWWQANIIKARDSISKAQHYLEFEEKQPALDAMALQEENHESGLYVTGRTPEDNTRIKAVLEDLELYGEWNAREGYWFLPEEEDLYDGLENTLEKEFQARDINARIEGVFKEEKTDYQKRREAEADYKPSKKDVPPRPFKEPKNDYFARRKKELE